jgi:DNA-binding response OmpR family regulator
VNTIDAVVLLSEPDPATNELYQRALRSAFEVIAAPDQRSIVHLLRTRSVTALVLEPALFDIPIWEQLAQIGEICAERGIPLVICSTLDERRRGIELGAVAYLVKPTLPATLLHTLRQVLGENWLKDESCTTGCAGRADSGCTSQHRAT